MSPPLRTLLFSTLYPSVARPGHGLFVENRLTELVKTGAVQSCVVAPVPWFPWRSPTFGRYAAFACTPAQEQRRGLTVLHPRYPLPPKIGMTSAPFLLALGALTALRSVQRSGFDFDLIDAHYFYPDGVAAALLATWLRKPLAITARGSDINLIAQYRAPRHLIKWAAGRAAASIAVSNALAERLRSLGVSPHKLHVMRNGVDSARFVPLARALARARLGLQAGPMIVTVGHLVEVKRQDHVIDALAALLPTHPNACLAIVGDGPMRPTLQDRARRAGIEGRVVFAGAVAQDELSAWYSAADLTVLASSREGWPNVLLESMACGTPVVASNVGGVPEIVANSRLGLIFDAERPGALAVAIDSALRQSWDGTGLRAHAETMSWDCTSRQQVELFEGIRAAHERRVRHA